MSEQAFEFEWYGKALTISRKEHSIDINSDREYIFGLSTIPGAAFDALLSERAHRAECWRELMEIARDMAGTFTPVIRDDYNAQLDALQAKWDEGAMA